MAKKLSDIQAEFMLDVAKLVIWANDNAMRVTGGELLRTPEQQELYLKSGKSKTANSMHLQKLAIDLNLFIGGQYKTDKESYRPLADYWKSLNPNNVAGYDWGWDANHFERKPI